MPWGWRAGAVCGGWRGVPVPGISPFPQRVPSCRGRGAEGLSGWQGYLLPPGEARAGGGAPAQLSHLGFLQLRHGLALGLLAQRLPVLLQRHIRVRGAAGVGLCRTLGEWGEGSARAILPQSGEPSPEPDPAAISPPSQDPLFKAGAHHHGLWACWGETTPESCLLPRQGHLLTSGIPAGLRQAEGQHSCSHRSGRERDTEPAPAPVPLPPASPGLSSEPGRQRGPPMPAHRPPAAPHPREGQRGQQCPLTRGPMAMGKGHCGATRGHPRTRLELGWDRRPSPHPPAPWGRSLGGGQQGDPWVPPAPGQWVPWGMAKAPTALGGLLHPAPL